MSELERIGEKLLLLDDYAIIGHSMPDGDSIGSILALYLALSKKGKKSHYHNAGQLIHNI